MSIPGRLSAILSTIPAHVTLVAITKTHPASAVLEAYTAGQKVFGENKVQELVSKYEELPKDIEWHMVGHLQTNKIKYIAPFVSLIHSVDSLKLLQEIQKQGEKNKRKIPVLLQVYIASEETKFGLDEKELEEICRQASTFTYIEFCGLMGMASNTEHVEQVKKEFGHLKNVFDKIKTAYFSSSPSFKEISMGMSGDYQLAIQQGSTMVRIGSSIFGSR